MSSDCEDTLEDDDDGGDEDDGQSTKEKGDEKTLDNGGLQCEELFWEELRLNKSLKFCVSLVTLFDELRSLLTELKKI